MRPTMSQVAELAGVSVATVSNVLSGNKYVSPELTKRVEAVVRELNYQPSRIARGLKVQKTYFIGLMVPDITNPFFAEIARGVESVALEHDYQLFLCNTDGDTEREVRTLNSFLAHDVDGIVNVAPRLNDQEISKFLDVTPQVIVDRPFYIPNPNVSVVYVDNYKGSAQLAEYLLAKGHRRFACISGPPEVHNVKERLEGFLHEIRQAGIPDRGCLVKYGEFKYQTGFDLMENILVSGFEPTAVFAGNDLMAWGALDAIKEAQLSAPQDIAIAGFDNVYFSSFLTPTLTTVEQPKFKMGQIAMKMLIETMKRGDEKRQTGRVMLSCELIPRDSA
jgi:LacI family transcriptional regulator